MHESKAKLQQSQVHFETRFSTFMRWQGVKFVADIGFLFYCRHLDFNKFHYVPLAVQGKSHLPVVSQLYVTLPVIY